MVHFRLRLGYRRATSRYFRAAGIPVIFSAGSADADHGYVFVQEDSGPCIGCLFPDIANDDCYLWPGTPAGGRCARFICD